MQYTEFSREKFLRDAIMVAEREHYRNLLDGRGSTDVQVQLEENIGRLRRELTRVQREGPSNGGYTDLATRTTVIPNAR